MKIKQIISILSRMQQEKKNILILTQPRISGQKSIKLSFHSSRLPHISACTKYSKPSQRRVTIKKTVHIDKTTQMNFDKLPYIPSFHVVRLDEQHSAKQFYRLYRLCRDLIPLHFHFRMRPQRQTTTIIICISIAHRIAPAKCRNIIGKSLATLPPTHHIENRILYVHRRISHLTLLMCECILHLEWRWS